MKINRVIASALCALSLLLSSCSIKQAISLKDCTYDYDKISDITFNGMTMSELRSISGIAKLSKFMVKPTEGAMLGFTVHMKVTNPNNGVASLERLFYTVALDSIEVGEGYSAEPFSVLGGATADLPLKVKVSLNQLLSSEARPTMIKTIKNLMGRGDVPTVVTVNLRPVIRVGTVALGIPKAIPLRFNYGGKEDSSL